jgi:hypothetical protein
MIKRLLKKMKVRRYKRRVCRMIMRTNTFVVLTDIEHVNGHQFKYKIRMLNMPSEKIRRRLLDNVLVLYRRKLN